MLKYAFALFLLNAINIQVLLKEIIFGQSNFLLNALF